jgi:hypothetical protein
VPGATGGKMTIGEADCPANPADRTTVPITKPGLGISADYGLPPTPNASLPDPYYKTQESYAYSKAAVDTGEIMIRGGSHLDFSWIPNQAFGASLRGPDIIDWYTTAWFDKYLKHDPSADARLLTERWRNDPVEAGIDPNHDGNAFSFYFYSRLSIHLASGSVFDCEDLREGCPRMVASDGYPGDYSYIKIDTTPDSVVGPGASLRGSSSLTLCTRRQAVRLRLRHPPGTRIVEVKVYVDRRHLLTLKGRSLRRVTVPGLPGRGRHTVRVYEYSRKGFVARISRRIHGCGYRAR